MRVKVFAVVPALVVLVSLCGSPVPPPPGTVTGSVYYDANRNGIRDTCDSPMVNTQVVVNGPGGKTASARTENSGAFAIDDAPIGEGLVTLFTGEGLVWPITTAPQAVRVESSKEAGGVEIGSASKAVYDATRMSISGVIFDDANGNGEVDRDECPISNAVGAFNVSSGDRIAVIGPGTYELKNLPEGHAMEVTASYSSFGDPVGFEQIGPRPLRPTNGLSATEPCTSVNQAKPRYGPLVYEANIGYTLAIGNGSVSGIVFDDSDGDGVQNDGEQGVVGVTLRLRPSAEGGCASYPLELTATTRKDGVYSISGIFPGEYVGEPGSYMINDSEFVTITSSAPPKVTVRDSSSSTLDVPVSIGPGGSVRVMVFDDDDYDGVRDPGEGIAAGINVCVNPSYYGPGYVYGNCAMTDDAGEAVVEPLPEGDYSVSISGPAAGLVTFPAPISVRVTSGEETRLDYAVAALTLEEQVIPAGAGESALDICDSYPDWVQPDFESGWSDEAVRQQAGYDEAKARLIYSHGIYGSYGFEMGVWSSISNSPWRFDKAPPGCGYGYEMLYTLAGYEPLEVMSRGGVTQVRLAWRGAGLFALNLPFDDQPSDSGRIELFVDENYAPIVRCAYGVCEWNDGTEPPNPGFGVD